MQMFPLINIVELEKLLDAADKLNSNPIWLVHVHKIHISQLLQCDLRRKKSHVRIWKTNSSLDITDSPPLPVLHNTLCII